MSESPPRLILASASPRRQDLLREAGYSFIVHPADIDEDDHPPGLLPPDLAEFLAAQKAQVVARRFPKDVVLAADTVVARGDEILGKPSDAADARRMLRLLSGTAHLVVTGVALVHAAAGLSRGTRVQSTVQMRDLTDAEIDRYVAGGDWQGKAGGYGLQDADLFPADHPGKDPFVACLTGSHSNIVGLPMEVTRELLSEADIRPSCGG